MKTVTQGKNTFTFHKYENAKGGARWTVDCNGREIAHDFMTRKNAVNYVESHKPQPTDVV